ncbi:MSCRAMM family protein [Listeria ivanovii]|nr:SpaA isopeptide-forming pilin-related protein [Listeria ivanovii]MBK3913383.1 LPXTG cell wall anchor domain-containing protein [Listeria ivanovii subsp. ivanovii]SNV39055.1 Predicted outer membrane protein [Listeria ivanovii subsp. ivanovii]SNV86700.1 Predicted outer membrane protein [Listeria ivanovii subsp. ivanovii]
MTLDLGNITQSYRLTYQTKITDTSPDVYTNNIIISGDNIQPYSIDVESDTSSGSGTAGGDFGSFELIKVDKNDHTVNLADAEFTLKSDATGTIYNLKTDTSGKASLDNLPLGDYTLTETKAPAGYQLDSNPVKVAINSTSKASYTFENEQLPPSNGAVEVTKVDSADATIYLADAEFNLVDENNNVVQTVTTNEAGKADLSNLVPGEYQLIETKAPAGYEIDSTPIPVSVNADQTTNITVENVKTPPAPVPPAPQPPVTPTEPSKPVTPKNSNESQISVKEENQKSSKKLPKTGDNNQTLFLVLLGVGLLFSAYRIKKTTKAN